MSNTDRDQFICNLQTMSRQARWVWRIFWELDRADRDQLFEMIRFLGEERELDERNRNAQLGADLLELARPLLDGTVQPEANDVLPSYY